MSSPPTPSTASPPPPTKALTSSMSNVYNTVVSPIETAFLEISKFTPVIFTLGSLFISIFTLNYPIFLLSIASGEAFLIQSVLKNVSAYMATSEGMEESKDVGRNPKCKSKYEGSVASRFKSLLDGGIANSIPNSSLFFLSFASAYCIQSMSFFTEESYERGASYSSRPYLGYIAASLCVVLFSIYNLMYQCATPIGVIISVILGLLVGFSLCYQNYLIFGKLGVDMLFIPPLVSRSGMDYICVSTN
jgi:hypothetical protein